MDKKRLRWISRFAMGIALFGFIVVVNFVLFFSYLEKGELEGEHARIIIAGNIIFLAVLFTIADTIYRKITVTKPMKRIQDALDRVVAGDFSTRIDYIKGQDSVNEFD